MLLNWTNSRVLVLVTLAALMIITALPAAADVDSKMEKAAEDTIIVGQAPPEIILTDMNGEEFVLSDLAGEKPVVIDFWATWCGPCKDGLPLLVEFNDLHSDEVEVIAVGVWMDDRGITDETINDFIEEYGLNFRVAVNWGSDLAEDYNISGIPMTVVIDKEGLVSGTFLGFHKTLIEDLEGVLGLGEE